MAADISKDVRIHQYIPELIGILMADFTLVQLSRSAHSKRPTKPSSSAMPNLQLLQKTYWHGPQ